ncbi:hypothetical protein VKA52_20565 [Halobacillus sp. HZG1]|uniref:hypothetical protein n=1 Tax=Halobacillus sp. HZG1 TaxID=3111769 RepID=UPI002DBE5BAB|nr:hypothetical protein [Halobacillus sp. HZG1]MEC3886125.1 hypothetical protein [Halobacillus sp. HZG1]
MYVVWVPCYVPVVYPNVFHHYPQRRFVRLYPEVDEDMFVQSASEMEKLMADARKVVGKISNSHDFANDVMGAAQESDQSKVNTLIRSAGVESPFQADYNPDRMKIHLTARNQQVECCQLTIVLRWRVQ